MVEVIFKKKKRKHRDKIEDLKSEIRKCQKVN